MNWVLRLAVVALVPLVPYSLYLVEATKTPLPEGRAFLYLGTGEQVKRMCPGFEGLMASVYWLRAVQYYGHKRAFPDEGRFELLGPLIGITNTLDPRMELAYRYGAIFLAESWPDGPGRPDEAIKVLEKGISRLPTAWRLRWDLGNIWFFYMRDDRKASEVFLEASKIKGAPFWLVSLAALVLQKGGHRDISRQLWLQQYKDAPEGEIRQNALLHIEQIEALNEADALTRLAAAFAQRAGRQPVSPSELVAAGLLTSVPRDPSGVDFQYDAALGRFTIARNSKYFRHRYD